MLLTWRSRVRVPMRSLKFSNLRNSRTRTMALGSTPPLREMGVRYLPGYKGRSASTADKLGTIC
jgi:hypothetical protein